MFVYFHFERSLAVMNIAFHLIGRWDYVDITLRHSIEKRSKGQIYLYGAFAVNAARLLHTG